MGVQQCFHSPRNSQNNVQTTHYPWMTTPLVPNKSLLLEPVE